ncbi:TPA: AIPR family protein [Klebsiella quasipneumoniae subsp. similipneumoniae]|nr:AIPR family protein [Klebsiella quasipneumoniae subsp. similipneumoniae]
MDKITSSLLDTFSEQYELSKLERSVIFEHFVNFSIISKLNRSTFDLEDIHTGSGNDCAIDGLTISINGRLIDSIDSLDDFIPNCSYIDVDVTFIQSKTSTSFDGAQILNFANGVKDFLSDDPKLVQNQKIKEAKILWDRILGHSDMMHSRRPILRMYFVCTGVWTGDRHLNGLIENIVNEIKKLSLFEDVVFSPLGSLELQKLYLDTKNKLSTTINFSNRITLPDIDGIKESFFGVVPFDEFIKLIQDEEESIYNIFYDNVRDFQGENRVNSNIKKTLEDGKFDLFSVLNNGVTLVTNALTSAGNRFTLRDYQIVNGCQTSNVLHNCQHLDGISNVFVPIKIIVTDNDDIKTDITLATNSQTEVKPEHLESLSIFQKQLELFYNTEKRISLYYERRSQQYNSLPIRKTQIVSIGNQVKCYASMFLYSPHLVSGYYGTIFNRFKDQMFNLGHKLLPYYVSALALYRLDQLFRSENLKKDHKKYKYLCLMVIRIIVMGDKSLPPNSNELERKCENLRKILINEVDSFSLISIAIKIVMESGIDISKDRYKTETETDLVRRHAELYLQNNGSVTLEMLRSITA